MEFHRVGLQDKEWITDFLNHAFTLNADYSYYGNYIWRDVYHAEVARMQDLLVYRAHVEDRCMISFPLGQGDAAGVLRQLYAKAKERGEDFIVCSADKAQIDMLREAGLGDFAVRDMRGAADYIYEAERLISLSGKKLHAKKNHVNAFEKSHSWEIQPIDLTNVAVAAMLNERWDEDRTEDAPERTSEIRQESVVLGNVFREWEACGLNGILLYADGEPEAFAVGSMINDRVLEVHFEKANGMLRGAYQMINREFVKYMKELHPELTYVNREDDMGYENLRKAKLSYDPCTIVEKYTLLFDQRG